MRYRVEFLREATEEDSVCLARFPRTAHLRLAEMQALAWSSKACRDYGAGGFQIRDLNANGRIVAVEAFNGAPPAIN